MRYLYIDTSSAHLYSAIVEGDKLIDQVKKKFGTTLSEEALPEIANLFTKNIILPKDIDKIIVVNGPGSFTGIRIGLTIAKTYAWDLNIPITAISSLEAMAISSKKDTVHVPIIDARRKYVYAAIYDKDYKPILKPVHIKIADLKKELKKLDEYSFITNDEIEGFEDHERYNPDILKIVTAFKDRKNINPHSVNPDYLKLTEAEESKLNDQANK